MLLGFSNTVSLYAVVSPLFTVNLALGISNIRKVSINDLF